ncbi:hypothetical protein [Lysinibacillus xylanilyticus]|nr:hypothetical protein [Lysinibacillus xylanilyticus]
MMIVHNLTYFAGVQTSAADATLSVQKKSTEIEELSLRTPRPVAMTE